MLNQSTKFDSSEVAAKQQGQIPRDPEALTAASIAKTDPARSINRSISVSAYNRHLRAKVETFRPEKDLRQTIRARRVFERVLHGSGRSFIFDFGLEDLVHRDAWMVLACREHAAIGSGYAHFDDVGSLWLRGFAVDHRDSGNNIMAAMAAAAIIHARISFPADLLATAAVRVLSGGEPNAPSKSSLEKLGFAISADASQVRLTGSYRDRHLFKTAEYDRVGTFTRYRLMFAGPDVFDQSVAFLAQWSERLFVPSLGKAASQPGRFPLPE